MINLTLEAMPRVTWNPNVPRMMYLIDSEEIKPVQNVPDTHGSQDIEKFKIRTRNATRVYF